MENTIITWFALTTCLLPTTMGHVDEWNLVHFSKSEEQLRECLKNQTELLQILHENVQDADWEYYIIDRLSYLTHEHTIPVEMLDSMAVESINILNSTDLKFERKQLRLIRRTITGALKNCADPKIPKTALLLLNEFDLPYFVQEIPELAEFLNLMLVSSELYLRDNYPLSSLYDLAVRAFALLESAFPRFNNDIYQLDNELLRMWNRRARLFYNGNDIGKIYISHGYKLNYPMPYSLSWPCCFIKRRRVPFNDRKECWITKSSNSEYFRCHKISFLQTLFLILELMDKGLLVPNTPLTCRDIPHDLRNIIKGGPDYHKIYIEVRLKRELSYGFANGSAVFHTLVQSLRDGNDDMKELSLLVMFWYRISGKAAPTTTSTTTSSSTISSSTLGYEESNRGKGQVTRLPSGKFRSKNQRRTDDDEGSSNPKRCKYSQSPNDRTEKYYGYVMKNYNSKKVMYRPEEQVSLGMLQDIFSSIVKSEVYLQRELICF